MKKTKILFFLPNLNGGGAERVAVNILRQLDLNKFDITLVLVTKSGKFLELIPSEIEIVDLKSKKTMLSILKLRKVILELEPDIVFSTLFRTHIAMDLALVGMKNKPKTIYRSPNSPKLLLENKQLSFIMKYLLERAYENADTIIAQTPEMKNEIVKYHKIAKEKINVMLNPLNIENIETSIREIPNPFNDTYINVVAAGRLTEQKGFDILIKSFKKVVETNDSFRLYIIGEDHGLKKDLIKLAESLNISSYVFFLGFQKNPYQYFYHCNLYVLSSRWEGMPNTVLECLYLEKPVVATQCIPFMDELISNGQNGILVNVGSIDTLAEAIINYKKINTSYKTVSFDQSEVSSLFQRVLGKY